MQSARATWTDERLDDLSTRVDRGFEKVDRDIRELRADMKSGHDALRTEIKSGQDALRREIKSGRDALRTEIKVGDEAIRTDLGARFDNLERTIRWFGGTLFAALLVAFLEGRF